MAQREYPSDTDYFVKLNQISWSETNKAEYDALIQALTKNRSGLFTMNVKAHWDDKITRTLTFPLSSVIAIESRNTPLRFGI